MEKTMPYTFENTITGLYNPTITTTETSWSNLVASVPAYEKKEEEPTVFNIDKIVEEAEGNEAMDNGGDLVIKTKVNAEIRIRIRPKCERNPYEVDHIVFGNPVTVVHWADGTRTVVKCQKSYEWNAYTAFCAALAKKVYGNNTKVCEIVEKKDAEYISSTKHMEKQKKIAETKAAEAKARAKRIKKMAKRMREQEEAAELAFGRTEKSE